MTPAQHVTIDELVIEIGPGARTGDVARELARVLSASSVEHAADVAGAIIDDLGRRGAMGAQP